MRKEDSNPLVSVLMTLYNCEDYISEAIESVVSSTYSNWELIIVDDISKDNSVSIVREYVAKDNRIKLFINPENLGDYPNRNKAASYANGKYLKYVDADDKIYPHGLEILVRQMETFPDAGFGLCSLEQDSKKMFPFSLQPFEIYRRHYIEKTHVFHKAPLSSIINRDVFNDVGGFANVRHYGDYDLWHRLSKKHNLVLMPHGIVWYRVSDGQEASVRRKNPINRVKTIHAAHIHTIAEDAPLSIEEKKKLDKMFLKQKSSAILFGFRKFGWKKGIEMKRYLNFSFFEIIKYKIA
jgi:glycosyltransferase involved in cell wall biosynthesis